MTLERTERAAADRLLHTIHAVRDQDALRRLYLTAFGGQAFAESYHEGEDRDMTLLYVADHMVEPMAPRRPDRADTMLSRYLARYGEGWHSTSIQVGDAALALERLRALGAEITTDYPGFFFVHPRSTGGIVFEVTDYPMLNDPKDEPGWNPRWAAARRHQPGALDAVVCCVRDIDPALRFFTEMLDGALVEKGYATFPQPCVRARIALGDGHVELLCPSDDTAGELGAFLAAPNSGVYALSWRVADMDAACEWMRECGIDTAQHDGLAELSIAGARHWLRQG